MNSKTETTIIQQIVSDLNFLVEKAKERKVEQGIFTFSNYINKITESTDQSIIDKELSNLSYEMSGMGRFASFPDNEWDVFDRIQKNISIHLEKNKE